jgi:peptide/nickel transport system substrate-binding protein
MSAWRWAALLLVLSLVLSACAAPAAAPAAPAADAPAADAPAADAGGDVSRADTLIFAADLTDLITLDPAVAYEFSGIQAVGSMYETLVSFIPGQEGIQPLLAESWDIVDSGDMWTVTFKLNPAATFASGNPVTAEDIVYSWGRAIDINKSPAFLFTDIAQLAKENMTAVDAGTLEVKLPKSSSPQVFLSVISFSIAAAVEKAALEPNLGEDMGESWLNDNSAGSGPYVLNAWDRSVSVTLDANPSYWGAAPIMKKVIMRNELELGNLQALIETGDADIVQDIGAEQRAVLEGNPDVVISNPSTTVIVYAGMNATKAPLDNNLVRQAIRYAINYDDIIALLGGNGTLVQEIIPIGFFGHTGNNPFSQDIEKAKALLAEAGVAEGTEINAIVPTGSASGGIEWSVLASKIQADLALAGLTLNIQQMQTSELLNIYRAQEGEMIFISWGPDFPDPDGNATPFSNYEAQSLAWRNAWNDQTAIDLSKAAAVEADPEKRAALYAELTDYVQNNGPYVLMYQPTRTFAARADIQGFVYDPADTPSITFATISR